jgi:hypothetical protein
MNASSTSTGSWLIEIFYWETSPGYAIHLLNYINPNAQHSWLRSMSTLDRRSNNEIVIRNQGEVVELLKSGQSLSFRFQNQMLQFTVASLEEELR